MALTHPMVFVKAVFDVCGVSGGECIPKAFKAAKKNKLSVHPYIGLPARPSRIVSNTDKAGLVSLGGAHVSSVVLLGYLAKVLYSIVKPIAVDVVNLIFGKLTVNPKPRDPVCGYGLSVYRARLVSMAVHGCERLAASVASVEHSRFLLWRSLSRLKVVWKCVIPEEFASKRAVGYKLSKFINVHRFSFWLTPEHNTCNGGVQYVR